MKEDMSKFHTLNEKGLMNNIDYKPTTDESFNGKIQLVGIFNDEAVQIKSIEPKKRYGNPPVRIGKEHVEVDEMMYYQYLPIKLKDNDNIYLPKRLKNYKSLIYGAIFDYFTKGGDKDCYIYVTLKVMFTPTNTSLNREGWHSDGFMSDDINYIWSDTLPTEYIEGEWDILQDHKESLLIFNHLGNYYKVKTCEPNVLYRLDESVIHRVQVNKGSPILRQFMKVSFSKDKYNLKGNSHNYLIDYDWEMKDRDIERNHPNK